MLAAAIRHPYNLIVKYVSDELIDYGKSNGLEHLIAQILVQTTLKMCESTTCFPIIYN